jgi:hypothetical protein
MREKQQRHLAEQRTLLAVMGGPSHFPRTTSPRVNGYILATSRVPLALASLGPLISQAEGRGFETRRPLSSIRTDLH